MSGKEYEVTIGIPVYNVEKYIRTSLESALNQTFESIEFLIIDDCGIDSSINIVKEYQQTHPRGGDIFIVSQPHNMGVSKARNRVIDEAHGLFLFFMDSDDALEPNAIELLMGHQRRFCADIVFGSHDKIETYNNNRIIEINTYPIMDIAGEDSFASYAYQRYGNIQTNIWNFCINVEVLRHSKVRFIDVDYWEDMAFMFDLVPFCNRAVFVPNITYHYLCRLKSLSNYQKRDYISKKEILQRASVVNYMKNNMRKWSNKEYYPQRCYIAALTGFYVACNVIKNRRIIKPKISSSELKSILNYPVSFEDILFFKQAKWRNLFLFGFSKLPAFMVVLFVILVGKIRKF